MEEINKKVFYKVSYGLYVVSSRKGDSINGQIANTVFQTTSSPPTFAVCLNKDNLTTEYVKESGYFTISILSEDTPMKLIGLFGFKSGREVDKFKEVSHKTGKTGVPILIDSTLGYIECKVKNSMELSSHILFVGEVVGADVLKEGEPMTYDYYHRVKKGLSPKNAPTYIEEKTITKEGKSMPKYRCKICGYIYDPEKGDPDAGIKPGTSFEDLPDDWVCPICGAGKEQFEKVEE